jgi:hypothetical protein
MQAQQLSDATSLGSLSTSYLDASTCKNSLPLLVFAASSPSMAWTSLLVKALSLGAIVLAIQALVTYLRSPLKNIPGPFLARFSNVWRLLDHYNQTHIETQRKLHKKHGDFVRLGPNTVSIADASLLRTIYSTRGTFKKVYILNRTTSNASDDPVE